MSFFGLNKKELRERIREIIKGPINSLSQLHNREELIKILIRYCNFLDIEIPTYQDLTSEELEDIIKHYRMRILELDPQELDIFKENLRG